MNRDPSVAVGLLNRRDLDVLGSGFRRAYPLQDTPDFGALLKRIDDADMERKEEPPYPEPSSLYRTN